MLSCDKLRAETRETKRRLKNQVLRVHPGDGRPDLYGEPSKTSKRPSTVPSYSYGAHVEEHLLNRKLRKHTSIKKIRHRGFSKKKFKKQPRLTLQDRYLQQKKQLENASEDPDKEIEKQEENTIKFLLQLREKYNRLKADQAKKLSMVEVLQDKIEQMHNEDDVISEQEKASIQIREKQKKVEDCKERIAHQEYYTQVLESMLNKLQIARLEYDNTLHAYEEAIKVTDCEAKQTNNLCMAVKRAKEEEENELKRMTERAEVEREYWKKNLDDRKRLVAKRKQMREWFEERKKMQEEVNAKLKGDLNQKGEDRLRSKSVVGNLKQGQLSKNFDSLKDACQYHEDIRMQLTLATGLSDIDDIIQRYKSNSDTKIRAEKSIETLKNTYNELFNQKEERQRKLNRVKYTGTGVSDCNREEIDKQSNISDSLNKAIRQNKEEKARLSHIVIDMEQAAKTLSSKIRQMSSLGFFECGNHLSGQTSNDPIDKQKALLNTLVKEHFQYEDELDATSTVSLLETAKNVYNIVEKVDALIEMSNGSEKSQTKDSDLGIGEVENETLINMTKLVDHAEIHYSDVIERMVHDNQNNVRVRTDGLPKCTKYTTSSSTKGVLNHEPKEYLNENSESKPNADIHVDPEDGFTNRSTASNSSENSDVKIDSLTLLQLNSEVKPETELMDRKFLKARSLGTKVP